MGYNKTEYWNTRKDPNNDDCRKITSKHLAICKPFVKDNINILDYGPGIGRMLELYDNQQLVSFYDITDNYLERLQERIDFNRIKEFVIDKSGKIKTKFKDNEFDMVCSFEVLLHSPHNEIKTLLEELGRIGKKVMIITWYIKGEERTSGHCFTRDYKSILDDLGFTLHHWDETTLNNQTFFIYSK